MYQTSETEMGSIIAVDLLIAEVAAS